MFKLTQNRSKILFALALLAIVFAALTILGRPAKAEAANSSKCSASPTSAYMSTTVAVELYDENGTFQGYAQNYTFNVQVYTPWYSNYGSGFGGLPPPGIVDTASPGFSSRRSNETITANGGSTAQCFVPFTGKTAAVYKFDVSDSTGNRALDCYYNPRGFPGFNGDGFTFTGVSVGDSGWDGGFFENPRSIDGGNPNNDLNYFNATFTLRYHKSKAQRGGVIITKYGPGSGPDQQGHPTAGPANANSVPGNASVCVIPGGCGKANSFNVFGATNSLAAGGYQLGLDPPAGYRIKAIKYIYYDGSFGPPYGDLGTAKNPNVIVGFDKTLYVDVYYEPTIGNIQASCNDDPTNHTRQIHVDGSNFPNTVGFVDMYVNESTVANRATLLNDPHRYSRATISNSGFSTNIDVLPVSPLTQPPPTYSINAYPLDQKANGDGVTQVGGSPATIVCETPRPQFYPWLQTQKGNVSSAAAISGQQLDKPGSRTSNFSPTEADFVIAAATNGGRNFCSNNLYTLAINSEQLRKQCNTGGYSPAGINFDSVKTAVNNAWNRNGAGAGGSCKPYTTQNVNVSNGVFLLYPPGQSDDLSLGCSGGSVRKVGGNGPNTLASFNPGAVSYRGRSTLWVTGDLTITTNIFANNNGPLLPGQLANLAIFVDGNVKIEQGVDQIDASIIATGTISSCSQAATQATACNIKYTNNGFWAGNKQIDFARRWFFVGDSNTNPAELIKLTGQSIAFPPPGLDTRDDDLDSQLQFNNGELPPRLLKKRN